MNARRACLMTGIVLLIALASVATPGVALAAPPIVLDGHFSDWEGRAYLEDPYDDVKHHWDDVRYWYWATNEGVSSIFFMVQRYEQHGQFYDEVEAQALPETSGISEDKNKDKDKKQAHYTIFIDTDNDGEFSGQDDAVVYADHYPKYDGLVMVSVFRGGARWTYSGNWGETDDEGGLRCEWSVSFSRLGIQPGQTLRMVLFAQDKRYDWEDPDPMEDYEHLVARREADRVPDAGDLQWAPISTLGDYGWLLLVGAGTVIPLVIRRRSRQLR